MSHVSLSKSKAAFVSPSTIHCCVSMNEKKNRTKNNATSHKHAKEEKKTTAETTGQFHVVFLLQIKYMNSIFKD